MRGSPVIKSIDILKILFPPKKSRSFRAIHCEHRLELYFHETIYTELKTSTIKEIFSNQLESTYKIIDVHLPSGVKSEFLDYITNVDIMNLEDRSKFERFIDILIYLKQKKPNYDIPTVNIQKLIYTQYQEYIQKKYSYESIDEFKSFMIAKLTGQYPIYPYDITISINIGLINNEFNEEIIFSHSEILDIAKDALDNLIANNAVFEELHLKLLYSCINAINANTRIISYDSSALKKIKDLILKTPNGYLNDFVRLRMWSSNDEHNSITCEPTWDLLFSPQEFADWIKKLDPKLFPNLTLIRNFWRLFESNNYKPIEFLNQGNVQSKIDNSLIDEVSMLDEAMRIEQEYKKLEKNQTKHLISALTEIHSRLQRINLDIEKINKLKVTIDKELTSLKFGSL